MALETSPLLYHRQHWILTMNSIVLCCHVHHQEINFYSDLRCRNSKRYSKNFLLGDQYILHYLIVNKESLRQYLIKVHIVIKKVITPTLIWSGSICKVQLLPRVSVKSGAKWDATKADFATCPNLRLTSSVYSFICLLAFWIIMLEDWVDVILVWKLIIKTLL